MSGIEDRAKFDNYEMKEEYDFSDGMRGRFYKPKKVPVTLRLDDDIILYFKKKGQRGKGSLPDPYQRFFTQRAAESLLNFKTPCPDIIIFC